MGKRSGTCAHCKRPTAKFKGGESYCAPCYDAYFRSYRKRRIVIENDRDKERREALLAQRVALMATDPAPEVPAVVRFVPYAPGGFEIDASARDARLLLLGDTIARQFRRACFAVDIITRQWPKLRKVEV